jgi:exonuclease VII large subunit
VRAAREGNDVVLAVRERGRPLGLASYDTLEAAQAVADAPVPVVAALGGEGTRTAVDEVAWASLPTADAAVEWLLGRLADAERRLSALGAEVASEADDAGDRCRSALASARDEAAAAAEQAATRSAAVRRRRRLQLRIACALLAVAVVALALVLARPLLLLGLLAPVLVLAAVELWWRSPEHRRNDMSARDADFTQVLTRLHAVRDELRTTTSPERVGVLRTLAEELVADGERLLGVHLRSAAPTTPVPVTPAPVTHAPADDDGVRRPEPTHPVEEVERPS